jgi:outer membrane receptor protein involved in Fe transport
MLPNGFPWQKELDSCLLPRKEISLSKTHIIICLMLVAFMLTGQGLGKISGVVKGGMKPVEFANVFITLKKDSVKIVQGVVTDSLGSFLIEPVSFDNYVLNVRMIGFEWKRIPISIHADNANVDLGIINLEPDAQLLNAIEVTAVRGLIQKTEEGFTMNASENLTQVGGTAADLLKNMPGVLVGPEGEITLRGRSPLTMINGRVSGIAGIDRSAQLERIPASSIERIEIINNPSARYSADAEGGIINIILKKSEGNGTNGAFAVGAGLGDRYRLNASGLVNHKTKKWNAGAAYDNWYTTRTRRVRGDRTNFDLPNEFYLTQRRFDERLVFYQNAKATLDYTPNKNNNLNLEALWAFPGEDNNETLKNTYQTSAYDFTSRNQRHSNEIRRSHTLELALNYGKRYSNPDKALTASFSNAFNKNRENTDIDTRQLTGQDVIIGDVAWQRTTVYQKTNLANLSLDFVQPIAQNGNLELGYKGIARFLNSDFERASEVNGEFITDPLNSNIFEFNEQIHAAYAQFTHWTGTKEEPKWKYSFGLRGEQVWNTGNTLDDSQDFNNDYFNFFPSVNIFYYTPNRNNLKFSYSRRIVRPGLGQLNPFTDITDSLNQRAGNPGLKPELIHSMELSYNHSWQKAAITLATFYRLRSSAILPYTILDGNGVAFTQPLNFGNATTYGLEAIGSASPVSFWSMNLSYSVFQTYIDNSDTDLDVSTNLVSWYAKLINNFTLSARSKFQVTGNYTSPTAIPQGESVAVYFVDLGFQQKILKDQGKIGVVVTDVFNTQWSGQITSDYNFTFSRKFKLDTRAIMVTFGYTFGTSFKEKLMENRFRND